MVKVNKTEDNEILSSLTTPLGLANSERDLKIMKEISETTGL